MGHVTPLISLATILKEKYEVIYVGNKNSMEEEKCKEEGISFICIETYPFYRKNILKNFKTFKFIKKESKRLKHILKNKKIKAIITSGGFISVPLLLSFRHQKNIKKILLESNAVMGLANKFLARYVDVICFQFSIPKHKKGIYTGSPIIIKENKTLSINCYSRKILFLGGSNGAKDIVDLAYNFNQEYPDISIYVLTGKRYYKMHNFNNNVSEYEKIDNVASYFKYFDVVVSRAGGSTISELIATKTPNVLYPSNNVANNHQYKNALFLSKMNATIVIANKNEVKKVYELFTSINLQKQQIDNLKILDRIDTIKKITFLIEN